MKKNIVSLVLILVIATASQAQVLFNTARTLQKSNWSLGINPAYADRGDDGDFALFFHGGYGLGNSSDLGMNLGFGWGGNTYFGLDYEKMVYAGKPYISLGGGAHYWKYFGLDLTALVTFPINNVNLTTGLDMNVIFGQKRNADGTDDLEIWFPVYLPINLEVMVKKNIGIVFEGNILLNSNRDRYYWYYHGFTTVGGGINIYF